MPKKVLKASNVTTYNIGSKRASIGEMTGQQIQKHKPIQN